MKKAFLYLGTISVWLVAGILQVQFMRYTEGSDLQIAFIPLKVTLSMAFLWLVLHSYLSYRKRLRLSSPS